MYSRNPAQYCKVIILKLKIDFKKTKAIGRNNKGVIYVYIVYVYMCIYTYIYIFLTYGIYYSIVVY